MPCVINLAPSASGTTFDGFDYPTSLRSLEEMGADVVGLNCFQGPITIIPLMKEIRKVCKVISYIKQSNTVCVVLKTVLELNRVSFNLTEYQEVMGKTYYYIQISYYLSDVQIVLQHLAICTMICICQGPLACLPVPYRTTNEDKTMFTLKDYCTGMKYSCPNIFRSNYVR